MNRKLEYVETLLYYDLPNIFVGKDILGISYICLLVEIGELEDKFLCVPISPLRLQDYKKGNVDLRFVFERPESDEYYLAEVSGFSISDFEITPIENNEFPQSWLPDDGFFHEIELQSENLVVREAFERNRGISHWRLSPPESANEPKISAAKLAYGLQLINKIIKRAYQKSLALMESGAKEAIKALDYSDNEVYAFSNGSFTIHMQTTMPADLLGFSQISRAYDIIDEVSQNIEDPDASIQSLSKYGGHFVSAYKDLLAFIVESNIPIDYEWSMPSRSDTTRRKFIPREAKPVLDALRRLREISTETKVITGYFTKVDETRNTWKIHSSSDDRDYYGNSEISLAGITIHLKEYALICEEIMQEQPGTGREIPSLILKSFSEL